MIKVLTYLNDLISQPESSVLGRESVRVNVINEDVGEAVLGVRLVAEGQSQPLLRARALKQDILDAWKREKMEDWKTSYKMTAFGTD